MGVWALLKNAASSSGTGLSFPDNLLGKPFNSDVVFPSALAVINISTPTHYHHQKAVLSVNQDIAFTCQSWKCKTSQQD